MDNIEIEKRGPLTKESEEILHRLIATEGKLIQKSETLTIFFESGNQLLGSFEENKMSLSVQLIRSLSNEKAVELLLKLKHAAFHKSERVENVIRVASENIKDLLNILKNFGFSEGCPRFYYREDYQLSKYSLSLKKKGLAPDHFEIEVLTDNMNVISQKKDLEKFLKKNNLVYYSEEEYKNIMRKTFSENPPVDIEEIIKMKELISFV